MDQITGSRQDLSSNSCEVAPISTVVLNRGNRRIQEVGETSLLQTLQNTLLIDLSKGRQIARQHKQGQSKGVGNDALLILTAVVSCGTQLVDPVGRGKRRGLQVNRELSGTGCIGCLSPPQNTILGSLDRTMALPIFHGDTPVGIQPVVRSHALGRILKGGLHCKIGIGLVPTTQLVRGIHNGNCLGLRCGKHEKPPKHSLSSGEPI